MPNENDTNTESLSLTTLGDLWELRDKAASISELLKTIEINPQTPVGSVALQRCRTLGLVEGTLGQLKVTQLAQEVMYAPTPDQKRVTEIAIGAASVMRNHELDGTSFANLKAGVSKGVLGVLIRSLDDVDARNNALPQIGLKDMDVRGLVGSYLEAVDDPKRLRQVSNATRPFFANLEALREGLYSPTTNKIEVAAPVQSLGGSSVGTVVKHALRNLKNITGNPEVEDVELIDISFLNNLNFNNIDVDEDQGYFHALRYAITDKADPCLELKPDRKVRREHKKTLKEQIDEKKQPLARFREEWKSRDADKKTVLTCSRGRSGSCFRGVVSALEDKEKAAAEASKSFYDQMMEQPIISIGSDNPDTSKLKRGIILIASDTPRVLLDMLGFPEKEKDKLIFREFCEDLIGRTRMYLPGVAHHKHLEESLAMRTGNENPTREEVMDFVIDNQERLSEGMVEALFNICLRHGITNIPDSTREMIEDRFGIKAHFCDSFESLTESYRPNTIGDFPANGGLVDLTARRNIFDSSIDDLVVDREVDQIIQHFEDGHHTVTIIDGTSYDGDYIEGHYTPLGERVNTRLAQRLLRGEVPESLQHNTLAQMQTIKAQDMMAMLFGGGEEEEEEAELDINQVRTVLVGLTNYNPDSILVLDTTGQTVNPDVLTQIVELLQKLEVRLIVHTDKPLPGMEAMVNMTPILEPDLKDRITPHLETIASVTGVGITEGQVGKIVSRVCEIKKAEQDPAHLAMEILNNATTVAQANDRDKVTGPMIGEAVSYSLGTRDLRVISHLYHSLKNLSPMLKQYIFGQDEIIDKTSQALRTHVIGAGSAERPLSILYPGPTGVGKTWIAEILNRFFNIPFFIIDGSECTHYGSLEKLTGTAPGFVGEDEGLLIDFMKKHDVAVVFIDELDKMHPRVRMALMNFIDEGILASGDGQRIIRRGYTIMSATNAGAEKLVPGMSKSEIIECIGEAFKDENDVPKPELANRFNIWPMLGITETDFRKAIDWNLGRLGLRDAFMSLQIDVDHVDPAAINFIFDQCKDPCRTVYKSTGTQIGFGARQVETSTSERFFNLREIMRSIDSSLQSTTDVMIDELMAAIMTGGRDLDQEDRKVIVGTDGKRLNLDPVPVKRAA